ncbi:MAG: hypothetical protein J7M08_08610 [Planctomycetes bacterium]|nr:hypothetical protein [Planctomycetota bacterium]
MTGPTGDWHYPRRRHLRICREDEWGVCPAEPDWHCVPVWGDGFKLEAEQTYFFPETSFGGFRRTVLIPQRQDATGRLETCLWPELAEFLLDMALERTSGQLASYCFDYFTPADPRRVRGVMVERVALHTQGGELRLRFELMGAAEEANADLEETDFSYAGLSLAPLRLQDATVTVAETQTYDVEQFTVTADNHLAAGPNRGGERAYIASGRRTVTLELRKLDNSDAFNDAVRTGDPFAFNVTVDHPGGHQLELQLPALRARRNAEAARPGELARAVLTADAATGPGGDDISYQMTLSD